VPNGCSVRIEGPNCLCRGLTADYRAVGNPPGGSTSWSSTGSVQIVGTSSDRASVRSEGAGEIATISVTYRVGDCIATAAKTIVMPRLDGITGPDCTCLGKELEFRVKSDAPACDVFAWSGGGTPATGTGSTFKTKFTTRGTKTITCRCGDQVVTFEVKVCEITGGSADPTVAFPNEPVSFSVEMSPKCALKDVEWSGGGAPATGMGGSFSTKWTAGGTYTVTAKCGASTFDIQVTICAIDQQLVQAAAYFGPSLDLSKVEIKGSSLVIRGRPFTVSDTIRFERGKCPKTNEVIHELGHVWEHQNGQTQLLSGIVEQLGNSLVPGYNPYDYGGPAGVHGSKKLEDFSKESQAQIIEEYWKSQNGFASDRNGKPFAPAYVADLKTLVQGAGIGTAPAAGSTSTVGGSIDTAVGKAVNGALGLIGQ
jgi:hypothetical protein